VSFRINMNVLSALPARMTFSAATENQSGNEQVISLI
jgi:hypothetical protein